MGKFPRPLGHHPRRHTVHTADSYDIQAAGDGESVHTHDVHPDTGELCLCRKSGSPTRPRGLECLGTVHIHWLLAGLLASNEFVVRVER